MAKSYILLYFIIVAVEFPEKIYIDLVIKLGQIEERTAAGTSEGVQLNALVSAFQNARDISL